MRIDKRLERAERAARDRPRHDQYHVIQAIPVANAGGRPIGLHRVGPRGSSGGAWVYDPAAGPVALPDDDRTRGAMFVVCEPASFAAGGGLRGRVGGVTVADRKKNEDALLLALACGATVEAASRQCGLSDRTIYRRLEEPEFKAKLQDLRSDMVRRAAGMLTAAANEAVRTLLSLQKEATPPAVRLGAARAVLEMGLKLREMVDLEARMAELEARLAAQDQPGPRGVYG